MCKEGDRMETRFRAVALRIAEDHGVGVEEVGAKWTL